MQLTINTMNLKERIVKILEDKKYAYADLAKHLNVSTQDLDNLFDNSTIEIRMLELISKELRIPLYSFFRGKDYNLDYTKTPYYNVNLWKDSEDESKNVLAEMQKEVDQMKIMLAEKEKLLKALEAEQKSKT